jgi:hypothetical protein
MSSETRSGVGSRRALSTLLAFAAVATVASMVAINPYRYGVADQVLTIPFLKQWIDPGLYLGDYIVQEKSHLYTLLWPALAYLVRGTGLSIETVFLWGYAAALFATFVSIGVLARTLADSTSAGLLAMFIAVFAKSMLAGSATIEDNFLTRVAALPFALFAFTEVLRNRHVRAAALLGIAFVIHPLTGAYAVAMIAAVFVVAGYLDRPLQPLAPVLTFLAMASPVLVWRALDPVGLPLVADPEWLDLLRLRSPHHISALTWSSIDYVSTLALVAVVFACAPRAAGRDYSTTLVALALGTLGLFAIALIFTEILPLSPAVQLQLFRASAFLAYLAIVAYATALVGAAREPMSVSGLAALWLIGFVVLYGAKGWPFDLVALALVLGAMAAHLRVLGRAISPEALALLLTALVSGLAFGAARGNAAMNTANAQPREWLDVQRWARDSTPRDAIFVVPPSHEGFRVESERSIYGDWKDGTQAFFNADIGYKWLRRMQRLGFRRELAVTGLSGREALDDAYRELGAPDLRAIVDDIASAKPVYVVDFADANRWDSDPVFSNKHYAVHERSNTPPK